MPALQARRLRRTLVLQVRIAQGEELVGGRTRNRFHEDREARLRQSSLAALAHVQRQQRADAVVVRRLQEGAPHRDIDFIPLRRAATSGWKTLSRIEISKTRVSRKNTTGLVAPDWQSHCEIWIHSSELDSPERWRSGVLRSGERRSNWTILEIHIHGSGNSNEG